MAPLLLRVFRQKRAALVALTALALLSPVLAGSGQVPQQPAIPRPPQIPSAAPDADTNLGMNPEKLERLREDDRRKRLLSDTAKLVALSNQLNDEVQKSSKDQLSLEVVRKAEEIEKLAHDVKERMKS